MIGAIPYAAAIAGSLYRDSKTQMKLQPINNLVLIKPDPEEETIGNIHLPQQARKRQNKGTVFSAPVNITEVKEGDHVVFSSHNAAVFEDILFIPKDQILAIIIE